MNEKKQYNIDKGKMIRTFEIKNGSFRHKHCKQFKLLPYVANDEALVSTFKGVLGAFSRIVSSKELKDEFNSKEFIKDIVEQVGEFEGEDSEDVFADIIESIFIDKESLIDFDVNTMNYISSTKQEEKIAGFLFSIFFNEELSRLVLEQYDKKIGNVLYELVLNALPELVEKEYLIDTYKCYIPFIKDLFIKDFEFIMMDEELYKDSLQRYLEFYYMFYISQLSMKLNDFEKADLTKVTPIYYTLNWESTSKNRKAYQFGWDLLKRRIESLFSHAVTLEMLNHHKLGEQLGYKELFELFNSDDKIEIPAQIEEVYEIYTSNIKDIDWGKFKGTKKDSGCEAFDKVYKLFEAVQYQFKNSERNRANKAYINWYVKFVNSNFAKKRGPLGYNLNLDEEDIILMTKICINNNQKLKLNVLFEEFEKRGMFFDRDSKLRIIELYEKLNLLEKKSDSGDAQYVRSIL